MYLSWFRGWGHWVSFTVHVSPGAWGMSATPSLGHSHEGLPKLCGARTVNPTQEGRMVTPCVKHHLGASLELSGKSSQQLVEGDHHPTLQMR